VENTKKKQGIRSRSTSLKGGGGEGGDWKKKAAAQVPHAALDCWEGEEGRARRHDGRAPGEVEKCSKKRIDGKYPEYNEAKRCHSQTRGGK